VFSRQPKQVHRCKRSKNNSFDWEVEEELRRNEDRMRLEEETIAAFGDARPSGFIHKPYKIDVLMEWVQRSLSE